MDKRKNVLGPLINLTGFGIATVIKINGAIIRVLQCKPDTVCLTGLHSRKSAGEIVPSVRVSTAGVCCRIGCAVWRLRPFLDALLVLDKCPSPAHPARRYAQRR